MKFTLEKKDNRIFISYQETSFFLDDLEKNKENIPKGVYDKCKSFVTHLEREKANDLKNDKFVQNLVDNINRLSPPNDVPNGRQSAFVSGVYANLVWGMDMKKKRLALHSLMGVDFLKKQPDITAYGRFGYDGGWASKVWIHKEAEETYFFADVEGDGSILITKDICKAIVQYACVNEYKPHTEAGKEILEKNHDILREVGFF